MEKPKMASVRFSKRVLSLPRYRKPSGEASLDWSWNNLGISYSKEVDARLKIHFISIVPDLLELQAGSHGQILRSPWHLITQWLVARVATISIEAYGACVGQYVAYLPGSPAQATLGSSHTGFKTVDFQVLDREFFRFHKSFCLWLNDLKLPNDSASKSWLQPDKAVLGRLGSSSDQVEFGVWAGWWAGYTTFLSARLNPKPVGLS